MAEPIKNNPELLNELPDQPSKSHRWKQSLGYLAAFLCLVWVFHNIHIEQLFNQLVAISWPWIFLGILFDIASYGCQGLRWSLLLKPIGSISTVRTTQAIYAGLFTNEVLPLRAGELVRVYLVADRLKRTMLTIVPSIIVERFFDGIWLAIGLAISAIFVELPQDMLDAADFLGVVVILATAALLYLIFHPVKEAPTVTEQSGKVTQKIKTALSHLRSGIRDIGLTRSLYLALLTSFFLLAMQILSFWMVMIAYHLHLSLWAAAVVMLTVHIGTALPNAPSNLGTYQFFCVVGLSLFGIDKTTAGGFSMVVFIVLTLPLWALGLLAISRTGMKLTTIHNKISVQLKREKHS